MSVRLLLWLKFSEMSWPNVYPAPRGEIPQPPLSSGSDHSRSHIGPCTKIDAKAQYIWLRANFMGVTDGATKLHEIESASTFCGTLDRLSYLYIHFEAACKKLRCVHNYVHIQPSVDTMKQIGR